MAEYAERMSAGERFDPVLAYRDVNGTLRLAAGFHRVAAARVAGNTHIAAVIYPGDRWAAVQAGLRDNRQHRGERLSSADKRYAAGLVLGMHPEFSDAMLASLVGCSDRTIARYRSESGPKISGVETRVGCDGKQYPVAKREVPRSLVNNAPDLPGQPLEPAGVQGVETAAQKMQAPGSMEPAATDQAAAGEQSGELDQVNSSAYAAGQTADKLSVEPAATIDPADTPQNEPSEPPSQSAGRVRDPAAVEGVVPDPDRAGATPGPQAPSAKPLADLIHDAQKRLGFFARAIDELRSADGARYRRLRGQIESIGAELNSWPTRQEDVF